MMRYIMAAKKMESLQAGQIINQVGKYLYNHIDSALRYKKSGNMFDVWFVVYYQKPEDLEVKEMGINLNLTTYADKIRMNIIEVSPNEKTLGQQVYEIKAFNDTVLGSKKAFEYTQRIIRKAFSEYKFLF